MARFQEVVCAFLIFCTREDNKTHRWKTKKKKLYHSTWLNWFPADNSSKKTTGNRNSLFVRQNKLTQPNTPIQFTRSHLCLASFQRLFCKSKKIRLPLRHINDDCHPWLAIIPQPQIFLISQNRILVNNSHVEIKTLKIAKISYVCL